MRFWRRPRTGALCSAHVDTDGFASAFGYHASEDDFAAGLETLLRDDTWRPRGENGHAHVVGTFAIDRAIGMHVAAYRDALSHTAVPGAPV